MKNISSKHIIDIVLIALLLIFIGQNMEGVRVKFLFFGFELPLFILILIVFFIGYFTAKTFQKKPNETDARRHTSADGDSGVN